MEFVVLASARKHGIDDADMIHAVTQAIDYRVGTNDTTLAIGPARNGALLEVGFDTDLDETVTVIFHAMPARPQFLR